MARISPITSKEHLAPEHHAVYDSIAESRGGVGGPFGYLLHAPPLAGLVADLGGYIRFKSHLRPEDEELAIITVAREWDCHVEWSGHVRLARRVGVREEAIEAVRDKVAPKGLTDDEAGIVRYVHELVRTRKMSAGTYEAALRRYDVQGLMELTALVGYYALLAGVFAAFEVGPPENAEPLPV